MVLTALPGVKVQLAIVRKGAAATRQIVASLQALYMVSCRTVTVVKALSIKALNVHPLEHPKDWKGPRAASRSLSCIDHRALRVHILLG